MKKNKPTFPDSVCDWPSCFVGIRAGTGGNTRNLHLLPGWFLLVLFLSCCLFLRRISVGTVAFEQESNIAASHCGKNTVHFDFCLSHCLFSTCHYVNGSHFYYLSAVWYRSSASLLYYEYLHKSTVPVLGSGADTVCLPFQPKKPKGKPFWFHSLTLSPFKLQNGSRESCCRFFL